MRLLPDEHESQRPIRYALVEVILDEHPVYEAVLYTWESEDGDCSASRLMSVDDCLMLVTRNCEAAPRQIRLSIDIKLVWIDAACIYQNYVDEVNQQVKMMGDIYRKTQQTLIWFGNGTAGSSEALA